MQGEKDGFGVFASEARVALRLSCVSCVCGRCPESSQPRGRVLPASFLRLDARPCLGTHGVVMRDVVAMRDATATHAAETHDDH